MPLAADPSIPRFTGVSNSVGHAASPETHLDSRHPKGIPRALIAPELFRGDAGTDPQ